MNLGEMNQAYSSYDSENDSGNSSSMGTCQSDEIDCCKQSLSNLPMFTAMRQIDSASSLGTSTTVCSNPSQSTRADSDNQNFQDYSCNNINTRDNSGNESSSSDITNYLQNDVFMKELDRLALSMALSQRSDLDGSLDLDCAVDMSRISRISSQKFLQEFVIKTLQMTNRTGIQTTDEGSVLSESLSCQSLPMPKRSRYSDLQNETTTHSSFKLNQKPSSNNIQSQPNSFKRVHTMPSLNAPQTIIGPASASLKTTNNLLEKDAISPDKLFRSMIISQGITFPTDKKIYSLSMKNYFLEPTPELIAAYDKDVTTAARHEDLEALKVIYNQKGRTLQCCNRFGESILHVACRRGSAPITRFLLDEANVSLRVRDDFGRTPLHDACWTREPAFELVKMLIEKEPDLLLVSDKRGNTPLDYVRRDHWKAWCQFFTEMDIDKILPSEEMINRLKE